MSFFPDTCLPFPLVSLSHLLLCGVELFVFGGLFTGGRKTPPLQAASSLSAHHTEHDSPPSLWCRDELLSPVPVGSQNLLLRSLPLELHFKTVDRYDVREQTLPALGRVHKHCVILQRCGWRLYTGSVLEELMCNVEFFLSARKQSLNENWVLTEKASFYNHHRGVRIKTDICISKSRNDHVRFLIFSSTLCNPDVICSVWTVQLVITAMKLGLNSGKHERWEDWDWPVIGSDVKSDTDNSELVITRVLLTHGVIMLLTLAMIC